MLVSVVNQSGVTLTRGQVVTQTGISRPSQLAVVELATAADPTLSSVFGMVCMDIPDGGVGEVVVAGTFTPFDTSSYSVNDLIYLSDTPGQISSTPGTHTAIVGIVTFSAAAGCLNVKEDKVQECSVITGSGSGGGLPAGAIPVYQYGIVMSVPVNIQTTITSYTVPAGKQFHMTGYIATGDKIGRYSGFINLSQVLGTRSSLAEPKVQGIFPLGEIVATAGQTVFIKVEHFDTSFPTGDFEATLFGFLV